MLVPSLHRESTDSVIKVGTVDICKKHLKWRANLPVLLTRRKQMICCKTKEKELAALQSVVFQETILEDFVVKMAAVLLFDATVLNNTHNYYKACNILVRVLQIHIQHSSSEELSMIIVF